MGDWGGGDGGGRGRIGGQKRQFPYWSEVQPMEVRQRQAVGVQPEVDPRYGIPRHAPSSLLDDDDQEDGAGMVTDFNSWSDAEIKWFLDLRGEDYDDQDQRPQLIRLAQVLEYNTGPAKRPDGGGAAGSGGAAAEAAEEEEVDPLDAFMVGVQAEVKADKGKVLSKQQKKAQDTAEEEYDPMMSFVEARQRGEIKAAAVSTSGYNSDEDVYATARALDANADAQYDDNDNPITNATDRKTVEILPALEHGTLEYEPFNKEFYEEHAEVAAMSAADVEAVKRQLNLKTSGFNVPKPITSFAQCGLDKLLVGAISKHGYTEPTSIQRMALPAALSGRDLVGIAKTGSGKTAAFVLPMVVHIMDQRELSKGEGPIGCIAAPTRELAHQIMGETKKFSKPYHLVVCGVYGGMSKLDQIKMLKSGVEVVVCTPGRLIDMIKAKACSMRRTTYLVLDEVDRMFDQGFEPQVRSIVGQIRPERQTLLFSATMPRKVEHLIRDVLSDPVRMTVGEVGAANTDIRQLVAVLPDDASKLQWLLSHLQKCVDNGDVMIFAGKKSRVEEAEAALRHAGFRVAALHGDKDQASRMGVLREFKEGKHHVLVATDVAARGLDISSIKTVINLDVARDIDSHVHRIGRTGRAGATDGAAITLLTQAEHRMAGELVFNMQNAMQTVTQPLLELAMKDPQFRRMREKGGKGGGGGGRGGGGRGGGKGGGRGRGRSLGGLGLGFTKEEPAAPGAASAVAHVSRGPLPGFAAAGAPTSSAARSGFVSAGSGDGGGGDGTRKGVMASMMGARFKSSFVAASGGGLTPDTAAQVVAPKSGWKVTKEEMENKPLPPPPPTNAVQAAASQFLAGMGMGGMGIGGMAGMMGGMGGMGMASPQPNATAQGAAAAAAAARINAMLAANGGGGGSGPSAEPGAAEPPLPPPPPMSGFASAGKLGGDNGMGEQNKLERRSRWG